MENHPIIHVEFSAKDREATGKFYHDLFGWEVRQIPEMHYATFMSGKDSLGGGFSEVSDDYPAGTIMVYIEAKNIDENSPKSRGSGRKDRDAAHRNSWGWLVRLLHRPERK